MHWRKHESEFNHIGGGARLLAPLVAPVLLAVQNVEGHVEYHHYKPIDMGTFEGENQ
ncbi:MAG: hypothetical protein WCA13_01975 [Terriglobales bacterium]|jgi:hypothetical protein